MRRSRLIVVLMLSVGALIVRLSMNDTRRGPRRLSPSRWSLAILMLRVMALTRWAIRRLPECYAN